MDTSRFIPGDKTLIQNIVEYLKAKGIFDEYRHECLADVDTKSSCQNLSQRIDGYTAKFLANETWNPDLNKNELRNKLRRHIDESGMLAVGADHVVEQVINPKITQLFLPSIINVVHQYIREETEKLNAKQDAITEEDKPLAETSEGRSKAVSDPIADILAFSYSKSKQTSQSTSNIKAENSQSKNADVTLKTDKKKDDKPLSIKVELVDTCTENPVSTPTEIKVQNDSKESIKVKKESKTEDSEMHAEAQKKVQKGELKPEKRKLDEIKQENTDSVPVSEENVSNKLCSPSVPGKSHSSSKTKSDIDKSKLKVKSQNLQKVSSDVRKVKSKETSDGSKPPEKHIKLATKSNKTPTKDPSSPFKSGSSKSFKDDKMGEGSIKSKTSDTSIVKTSDSPQKKSSSSKISSSKKENVNKHKGILGKDEKVKLSKSLVHKSEQNIAIDSSSSCEKGSKSHGQYSSSHDSSQGSDQDKCPKSINPKVRQKLFSKHVKKEPGEKTDEENKKLAKKQQDKCSKTIKKHKGDKTLKLPSAAEKPKEFVSQDVAKISSRSNSFGSSSSISSSSNASKDNLSNSENAESSVKASDKKKKQASKEKDHCRSPQTFPPPPPPPSSGTCETQSSAEVSSVDDTQSSQGTDDTGGETSDKSLSESESDENEQCSESSNDELKMETTVKDTPDDLNALYDIFLYSSSSSSSEFEGYCSSPEKSVFKENFDGSDISVSSVHTSDLSSFDDELSDDEASCSEDDQGLKKVKKKLTIREAQEFLRRRADQQLTHNNKKYASEEKVQEKEGASINHKKYASSDEESNSAYEPKRELRRERKINPKYASSEYTSIFNSKKESFITKHSSKPSCQTANLNPEIETDEKKKELQMQICKPKLITKRKIQITNSAEDDNVKAFKNEPETGKVKSVKERTIKLKEVSEVQGSVNHNSLSSSDNRCRVALQVKKSENKCNTQNHLDLNSHSVKRKLSSSHGSPPSAKRPCSRSSVDSCSSEFAVNENKPFNSEQDELSVPTGVEQKIHKTHSNKNSSELSDLKKEIFSQQKNGDILGRVDHVKKNAQLKAHSTPEKNKSEPDINPELTAV